jgi:uncharacterized protein YkwD
MRYPPHPLFLTTMALMLAALLLILASAIPLRAGSDLEPQLTATAGTSGTPEGSPTASASPPPTSAATEPVVTTTVTPDFTATLTPVPSPTPTAYFQYLPLLWQYPPNSPPGCVPSEIYAPQDAAAEQAVEDALNQFRVGNDLPALQIYPQVANAARRHAVDMVSAEFVSHAGSDGSTAGQRLTQACFSWIAVGQIIGINDSASTMVAAWLASEPNRALILSPDFTHFGAGYAFDSASAVQHAWVVVFARAEGAGFLLE